MAAGQFHALPIRVNDGIQGAWQAENPRASSALKRLLQLVYDGHGQF